MVNPSFLAVVAFILVGVILMRGLFVVIRDKVRSFLRRRRDYL